MSRLSNLVQEITILNEKAINLKRKRATYGVQSMDIENDLLRYDKKRMELAENALRYVCEVTAIPLPFKPDFSTYFEGLSLQSSTNLDEPIDDPTGT
jgi:hypothetical protein